MPDYFSDSFTDTDATTLESHTPDLGDAWIRVNDHATIESGRVTNAIFEVAMYLTDPNPVTDDYVVGCTVVVLNARVAGHAGVFARWGDSGDPGNRYEGIWSQADAEWQLNKVVGGTKTLLGSDASSAPVIGTNRTVALALVGDALEMFVDGVSLITATDSTWTDGAGAGILVEGLVNNELAVDNFLLTSSVPSDPLEHAVSGRGNFAITGLNWLSTAIDSSGVPSTGNAEPPNYYHVGQLSWGTASGAMVAYPITRMLDLVWIPSNMDTLWYSFAEGVSATITELSTP